jgi:Transglycosylase SLT domain
MALRRLDNGALVRRSVAVMAVLAVGAGFLSQSCGPVGRADRGGPGAVRDAWSDPAQSASASAAPTPVVSPESLPAGPGVFLPAPSRPVPENAVALASQLTRTTQALRRSIGRWTRSGDLFQSPPYAVVLQALYQQRIYRVLGRRPGLARRTVALMPHRTVRQAWTNVSALADLFSLYGTGPVRRARTPPRTQPPKPAGVLARYYREAQERFGISWEVLAAVNFVESKFGRVRTASSAGAQGPMQFLPATWAAYGLGGDIHDPHDAVLGAANYLRASGAPGSYRQALYAYNHSVPYVNAVLLYAHQMERRPQAFLEYYNWQVFVVTPRGDRRLTGPGR